MLWWGRLISVASARAQVKHNNTRAHFSFLYSYTNIMSPSPILSPFDEAEERLTQPDAEADKAEAIDLTVESEAPNTKRSGPSKRKVITITPGSKTPNKKSQHEIMVLIYRFFCCFI